MAGEFENMKHIKHYKEKELCNRNLPSMQDPQNRELARETQQLINQAVDDDCWRASKWCESFTERFVEEVKKCKVFVDVGAIEPDDNTKIPDIFGTSVSISVIEE